MNKVFLDTNILIYFCTGNTTKGIIAKTLIEEQKACCISYQVLNEFTAVCLRKNLMQLPQIKKYIAEFNTIFKVSSTDYKTMKCAFDLMEHYAVSFWDSLIMASAIECHCNVLFTEDFQHNQVIRHDKKQFTIINPFV